MELDSDERAMLNGEEGPAKQVAMDLLIRYGEALGADRLIDTDNVAGVPGAVNQFLENYYEGASHDEIFSRYDLDSDRAVGVPDAEVGTSRLQGMVEPEHWDELGTNPENARLDQESEQYAADHDVEILKTCTPYHAGNLPSYGEHCAWMESSAVVFINSVRGARTNVEGRESTSAAMLTGKIPDWGLHREENRYGTHRIEVDVPVDDITNWGMLGYFVGKHIQEDIPVLVGEYGSPSRIDHKHFGAAAATSGGIELYHVVGETPEAETEDDAFGTHEPEDVYLYDEEARREVYHELNAIGDDRDVDFVMLGCPHYSIEQVRTASRLLEGRELAEDVELWLFSSRDVREQAEQEGHADVIRAAGGQMMTDTCSSMSQAVPPGTDVVALDSAKQVHYLPAIMDVEAWFGSTEEVIDAAVSGTWDGEQP
ncbi:aconitase X [Natronorubrum sp. FCH18a]|uniref:aconitase X n=1 Tax=Natronorubrum sp. FCH18a TaxID=3447018 RepID=UPI003F5142A3